MTAKLDKHSDCQSRTSSVNKHDRHACSYPVICQGTDDFDRIVRSWAPPSQLIYCLAADMVIVNATFTWLG